MIFITGISTHTTKFAVYLTMNLAIQLLILISMVYQTTHVQSSKPDDKSEPFDHHRVDHEAFLGPDDAKQFEHLSIDESKKKLGEIADKIDKDKDGFVSR